MSAFLGFKDPQGHNVLELSCMKAFCPNVEICNLTKFMQFAGSLSVSSTAGFRNPYSGETLI